MRNPRPGVIGIRDSGLLLVGFAGAYRRSELVALNVEDIQVTGDGLVITLRRSKTDQEGEGRKVGAMVRRYIRDGSLFRENTAATVGL